MDYTFLIFREDFMRTFIADKFFVYRLLYYYQTDTPPYLYASPEELTEYMRLLGKIKRELLHPVADTYNLIVSVLYYLLLIINRAYAAAYRLPVEIAKNNYAFQFKDLLEQNIRTMQRVQEYADKLRISRITLNTSVMAQNCSSPTAPSANWRMISFFRPQPLNALLQTADREDIHAVFAGLPERDI